MQVYEYTDGSDAIYVAELKDFDIGNVVRYGDGSKAVGVVIEQKNSDFMWPNADGEQVSASEENSVFIVARGTGGSKPFAASELESVDPAKAFQRKQDKKSAEKRVKALDSDNLADVYHEDGDVAELLNVSGVDDPEVGFTSWPDSWEKADRPARLIALDAWQSMRGTFDGCMNELGSRDLCAAFKDEMLGTEKWRGGFEMPDDD